MKLIEGTEVEAQYNELFVGLNIMDTLLTKPADLMIGEPPTFETGKPFDSVEQKRLNSIVEENDIKKLIRESVFGAGKRGDAWYKVFFNYRHDYSELQALGLPIPPGVSKESIIRPVDASYVFPELANGSRKVFKAINIAFVEVALDADGREIASYLNVERHLPGAIQYRRFLLEDSEVVSTYGADIQTYRIAEEVSTGREKDIVETGVPTFLVHHVPYKASDDDWCGISGVEKIEDVLAAINDRLHQIDLILTLHSKPTVYGPPLDDAKFTPGDYIEVQDKDATPAYMTWDAKLDAAFRELELLVGHVYQHSETPQWVFGTTITSESSGGTGTSHTDAGAIKARFFPLLTKVQRIRDNVDVALRDALYTAMLLENAANKGVDGWQAYEPPYPKIDWKDGLPRNEKEEAEVMQIRTGGRPTIDQHTAVKQLDGLDDAQATERVARIQEDEARSSVISSTEDPRIQEDAA